MTEFVKTVPSEIVLHNVSKHYGEHCALDGVSLSLTDKSMTAVVGQSGSGKSTLLQLINGLVHPSGGHIEVFGRAIDYHHLPKLRRQIGYAVQGTGLFPHLTAWENITLLARLSGWRKKETDDRGRTLMELVGLPSHLAPRYPYQLSGGQQQRVGLCRAMMLDPKIFLLDEPFGALDPVTRDDIQREFLHLQATVPRTIVFVTHDLREAKRLAQEIIVLDKGKVVQRGGYDEILEHPKTEFVREFFRSQLPS